MVVMLMVCACEPLEAEVVAVVSVKCPVTSLTQNQLTDIFLGRTSRFPDGVPVVPIDQMEGSVARNEFYSNIVGKSTAQIKAHWSKMIFTGRGHPPKMVNGDENVIRRIAENPNVIGYVERSLADVDKGVKVLLVQ